MKLHTKFIASTFCALALLGGGTVLANTWTVSSVLVPRLGGGIITQETNTKTTNSNVASFNGDATPNALGYAVMIVNSKGEARSSYTSLKKDVTTQAANNTGTIGYNYPAYIHSNIAEPNSNQTKFHFSADAQ
ncbi:MAG: choline-binding protein [Lactobacillaceae bacterium]|jgi:H2-forming N5,N10-methylenetetrahydromethanopterin dehydrogenase-like enzyme|nr:choline-binding protein [Lactobacillaceae bacterium]